MKRMDEADIWNKRLLTVDPENKEAYYTLGVIAWTNAYKPVMEARTELGMKPDEPGPLKAEEIRRELSARHQTVLQDGLDNLKQALDIDPEYDDAMAYVNLLWRLKADLEDSAEKHSADIAEADKWFQKCLETRKTKASRKPQ